jgi:ADP-ribose pyrophosphatase YjhB (NUDIX family)
MTRIDYLNDPDAPVPNSIVPAASAVVTNDAGEILLQRRSDNDLWALPGGTMDVGERSPRRSCARSGRKPASTSR